MIYWNLRIPAPFPQWTDRDVFLSHLQALGGNFYTEVRGLPWISVDLPEGIDPFQLPGVLEAEEDLPGLPVGLLQSGIATHPPEQALTWQTIRVNAPQVHPFTRGEGVTIAVLDTGFLPHPEFDGASLDLRSARTGEDTIDRLPHGAAVLGTLASQGIQVPGVAPRTHYLVIKIADMQRDSNFNLITNWGTSVDAANAIMMARDLGADIATMSFVFDFSGAMDAAIRSYVSNGGVFFAPSGNEGRSNFIHFPGDMPETICVGASTHNNTLASLSNRNTWPSTVDCVAPGSNMGGLRFGGGGDYRIDLSGTSYACPMAAGCFALSMAFSRSFWSRTTSRTDPKYGLILPGRVVLARELLRDFSVPLSDTRDRVGYGLVDAAGIAQEGDGGNGDPPPVVLEFVSVSPAATGGGVGFQVQLTATAFYSDGTTQDVTVPATWFTTNSGIADVSSAGLVTAVGAGSAQVFCVFEGVESSRAQINAQVIDAVLQSITLAPSSVSLEVGESVQLQAVGRWSDGVSRNVNNEVAWVSSSQSVATVSSSGVVAGRRAGSAAVTCGMQGVVSNTVGVQVVEGEDEGSAEIELLPWLLIGGAAVVGVGVVMAGRR